MHFNTSAQIAWRDQPAIGKNLDFDLYGQANQPWQLLFSLGRGATVFSFGLVALDLGTLGSGGAGTFDANGRATRRFMVPSLAALIGLDVYWQALMGAPPRVSNLERSTFGAF